MKIKNIEVNFDFLDADDMEKFENEAKKVIEECEKGETAGLSYSQVIREQCRIINNFFDNVFGEGISEKLFGNKNNLREHTDAFEEIVKERKNNNSLLQHLWVDTNQIEKQGGAKENKNE